MAEGNGSRITVSHDTLRAELAELELRLVDKLVSKGEIKALETRVKHLEEHTLTPVAVKDQINEMFQSYRARGFRSWEVLAGVFFLLFNILGFAVNLWVATRGG